MKNSSFTQDHDGVKIHNTLENSIFDPSVVILAAGQGTRLSTQQQGIPKPLQTLLGLSFAERTLMTFAQMGLKKFVVVLGYAKEKVRTHFEEIADRRKLSIVFVEAENWSKGNGASLAAASKVLKQKNFLLTMVDHVFKPELVKRFLSQIKSMDTTDLGVCLGVDGKKENLFDLSDATKVYVNRNLVLKIGKDLSEWNTIDTGLFYCTSEVFDALKEAQMDGCFSLSDGIRILAKKERVRAVDLSGESWMDVDTPEAWKETRRRMLLSIGKNTSDGYISQYFNRKISKVFSEYFALTSITPNQITWLSFFLCILGSVLIAAGGPVNLLGREGMILGALVVQFASIIDGCDGEVSRLKFLQTQGGAWLDTVLDRYADVALAMAVTYSASTSSNPTFYWVLGTLSLSGFILTSYVKKEYEIRFSASIPDGVLNKLSRRDLRIFVISIGVIVGFAFEALCVVGILSHICVAFILYFGLKGPFIRDQSSI